jgi:hypothetical protein
MNSKKNATQVQSEGKYYLFYRLALDSRFFGRDNSRIKAHSYKCNYLVPSSISIILHENDIRQSMLTLFIINLFTRFIIMIFFLFSPKFTPLIWSPPVPIDRPFYQETKEKLTTYPDLKIESEIHFWKSHWYHLFVIFLSLSSLLVLMGLSLTGRLNQHISLGEALIFIFLICLYPTIFGLAKLYYYWQYRKKEKKYHEQFVRAVSLSKDYEDFMTVFYADLK